MLVTDMPIWADCTFRDDVPQALEIRVGDTESGRMIVFWDPANELHVDVKYGALLNPHGREDRLKPILSQLSRAAEYKANGGTFAPSASE